MARIRSIKPEFWTSETVAALSLPTRLTFIGLWNYCDDYGVGKLNVRLIASALYPMDDPDEALTRVHRALDELAEKGRITFYEVDGRRYLQVTTWSEHQKVDRPAKSSLPRADQPGSKPLTSRNGDPREDASRAREGDAGSHRGLVEGSSTEQGAGSREGSREQGPGSRFTSDPAGPSRALVLAAVVDPPAARPEIDELCDFLADRIEGNGAKRPTVTARWRDATRLMLDRDGRTVEQIRACIDWCQSDTFWRANVLSMPTLREKYDQLRLHAARTPATAGSKPSTTDQRVAQGLALVERFAALDAAEGAIP